jgi:amidase
LSFQQRFMEADGFADVHHQLSLSGEPPTAECRVEIGDKPRPPISLPDFFSLTLELKRYREEMADQWASTASQTRTGRPVDAVILPVAPHAGVLPGKYYTYSYSSVMNARDYCSIVVPVTTASKYLDKFEKDYQPMGEVDRNNWLACE